MSEPKDGTEAPVRCSTCSRLVGFSFYVNGQPACQGFVECFECVKERDSRNSTQEPGQTTAENSRRSANGTR